MTTSCSFRSLTCAVAAWACLAVTAQAEVVVSNLYLTNTIADYVSSSEWVAQSFTTNNQAWTIASATLSFITASDSSGNLFIDVYSNGTNSPGTSLGPLSGSSNPAATGEYTYTSTGINLDPSTTYWLVAGVSSGSGYYHWIYDASETTPPPSLGVWSIPSINTYADSVDGGSSWEVWNLEPFLFSVEATAAGPPIVPEIDPATGSGAISLVAGVLAMIEQRRRRGVAAGLAGRAS